MSLDTSNTVDALGIDRESGDVTLSIIDSWDWDDEKGHLSALKEKLGAYFVFIESGEIYDACPEAATKRIRIDLIGRFPLPKSADQLLSEVNGLTRQVEVTIRFKHLPNPEGIPG
jgi:hypothetical protein